MLADLVLLIDALFSSKRAATTKLTSLRVDQNLRKAFVHAAHAAGDVFEAGAVKMASCTRHKAEFEVFGDFANLAQDGQVQRQLVAATRIEVFKELVHHQQDALARVDVSNAPIISSKECLLSSS